ncbi:disease resistance protein PIK6-NP-like [Hordeum vulgare subsp. vulgare]|uniref:RGH1 n=1 Tax=Hordeum vulgare subsp. vulgare TaxID=112509 RepID=A0A8I6WJV6_HORVV|nr:disease resistance protein PIK6-NP-like [Hordeum vulgare subsp. vulgare]
MAMSMATGAMGSLLPKLLELLKDEYKLKKKVRDGVESLEKEMRSMEAALQVLGEVPREQLDVQVKLWAGEVRELSFKMEDVVDKFLVHVDDGSKPAAKSDKLKLLTKKMAGLFTRGKARHEIADAIKDINKQVQEVAGRRARYNIDNVIDRPAAVTPIDPRLGALYTEVTELVGIAGKRDQEIMKLLSEGGDMAKKNLKIISVVGFGGMGKTTLVKTVYEKIEGDYDCTAFVPVGRKAEAKTVFTNILLNLGMNGSELIMLNEKLLIDKLREFLKNKRYLIVIDDIWDEELWRVIKCAFSSSNNFGSRLITTTRIVSVCESCCSSTNDSIYIMEPLSDEDSERLFYKRIFSLESGCPPEFEEVSRDVLKKCGGVPLAIITIASLLASGKQVKPKNEWDALLESIGRGLTENRSAKEMIRILSFSYYDLPSHLKTCLLYLSMFPEDSEIMKDQLIWMWIAESFVQRGKEKTSLFEVGETYFNELVNKSLIQPVYDEFGFLYACRVHDSVLDLICSLSSEVNFVTIVSGTSDTMSSEGIVRRWSLQNARKEEGQTMPPRSESIGQARSVVTFAPAFDLMPPLSSFVVLRVLDLNLDGYGGTMEDHLNLQELGSLLHLRYLRLSGRGFADLPEDIGKLKFLQVLVLPRGPRLPSTVIKLTMLMCLRINSGRFQLPDGVGNLRSMEVLNKINVGSVSIVQELGNMHVLRELNIQFERLELVQAFVESLGNMRKIQRVEISAKCEGEVPMDLLGGNWMPPPSLREFGMLQGVSFSTMPAWKPSDLSQLSLLGILHLKELQQEDLRFLGRLPALRRLGIKSDKQRPLLFAAEGFRCLERVSLLSKSSSQILFQPGALPKAELVWLDIGLCAAKEDAAGNSGDWFDMGMGNLPFLRDVNVELFRSGVTVREAKQAQASLENALRAHPKRPAFSIYFDEDIPEDACDEDVYMKGVECSKDQESK